MTEPWRHGSANRGLKLPPLSPTEQGCDGGQRVPFRRDRHSKLPEARFDASQLKHFTTVITSTIRKETDPPPANLAMMEPPAKRQRLGLGPAEAEDEDELDFDPEELNQRRDPGYQLEQARDRAAYKLKSRFESIFAKYERDFTGVGDEIDLRTGQVVVDNGHLESMRSVKDMGDGEEDDEDPEEEEEEERIMHGKRATGSITSDAVIRREPWAVADSNPNRSPFSPMMGGPPRLSSMMPPSHNSLMTPPPSFDSFGSGASLSIDPTWQAPDLPRSAFMGSRFGTPGRQYSFGMGASTRKVTMKALPAPQDQEEEDEDVLLGVSGNVLKKESAIKSPLIKENFPTVDSSPNNDPGLNDLIQEVIENIPETPPSVQRPIASKLATMRELSSRSESSQPRLEPRGRPRGRPRRTDAGETREKESIGEKLDISQENGRDFSAESPTKLKSQSNQRSLASRAGAIAQPSGPGKEASSFQEGDLELYQDVTGMPAMNFDRHAFYVEIEARNVNGPDVQVQPKAATTNRKSTGSESQDAKLSTVPKMLKRNVIDPSFAFSDEETLPPRQPRKDRRKSEPAKLAAPQVLQASRSNLQQSPPAMDLFQRNAVDPSYAFSDEENLLPRRANATTRKAEPAPSSTLDAKEDSAGRGPDNAQVSEPTGTHDSPSERKGRRRSMRSVRKPVVEVDTPVCEPERLRTSDVLPAESDSAGISPSAGTHILKPRTRRPRGGQTTAAPVSVHIQQSADQGSETADAKSSAPGSPTVRRRPGRPRIVERIASPELGDPAFIGVDTETEEVEKEVSEIWSLPAATPAPPQQPVADMRAQAIPSTPQSKSKSRAANKNTPSSRPGLISLLSDNEDEEDEISFDLSAFTPSGHHRILTRAPHSPQVTTTTPHMTSSSMNSKKKRHSSLLFGPSSTSKVRKHRTPGSERKDGKGKRRGSTNSLARSVVKVRRGSFRAPSPAGSVVQTPGGTKRRCGQDGFRCERDFCFVCISI